MDIFISERYIIHDALGSGGMGAVYRATDRLTNQTVALKRVLTTPSTGSTPSPLSVFDTPSSAVIEDFDLRIALAREFQMLATLRHPNIIDVLDYGFDIERLPFFTMRLLDHAKNVLEAGLAAPYLQRVDFAMQMIRALSYLHRRDILHRDIKPNNVLVADDHLYVVDFGLAQTTDASLGPVGSVPYVAPEVLRGKPSSEASDIYAAGIILYELFVGQHPFNTGDNSKLIDNVLNNAPNLDPLLDMSEKLLENGIEPQAIRYVIGQMLDKSPERRLPDAEAVIYALSQCTNHRLSVETIEIRESIIRLPSFVGRDTELAQLNNALIDATLGHGSAWLIGGESGAGKSRLLEEVRIRALVEGALVVRGQAHPDGTLQHAWGDIPRRLALAAQLDAHDAIPLRDIVPDIFELRDIPPSYAAPVHTRHDLDHMVELWLTLFQNQTRPLVVIMEDLHWAPLENLRVLQRLHNSFHDLPILWIGSYRDDEYPALPKRLPHTNLIKLRRFEIEEMVAVSESILGPVGRDTRLLALLERETGGNPFLIVEIIRALANQAGTLRGIHEIEIPDTLRTSTAHALIKRRLDHIPHTHRALLAIAALAGREIDLGLLHAITPDTDLNRWLTDSLNAAVVTKIDNQWYFAHDQLREGILEHYIGDQLTRRTMHLQIAYAIEEVYGDIRQKAAQLAYHFGEGQDYLKERHYSAVAGENLMNENAPRSALPFLERTTALSSNMNLPTWSVLRRAHLFRLLGDAYFHTGNATKARDTLLIAAELLGEPVPLQRAVLRDRLQQELLEQYHHHASPEAYVNTVGGAQVPRLMEAVLTLDRLAEVALLLSEQELAQYAGLRGVNLAARIGLSDLLARLYATTARIYHLQGDFTSGRAYSRLAVFIGAAINNPSVLGWAWLQRGNIAMLHADWNDVELAIQEAEPTFRQLSDNRRLEELWSLKAFVELEHRADLDAALKTRQRLTISAKQRGDVQFLVWGLNGQAEINVHRFDQLQTAIRQTSQASQLAREIQQPESVRALGLNALAHFHLGDFEIAAVRAEHTATALMQLGDTVVWRTAGIDSAIQVLFLLIELGFGDRAKLLEAASHLQYRLSQMVMRVPIAEVFAQRWLGTRAWIDGDMLRAENHWQIGLERAHAWHMPLQYARTQVEYARHLTGSARRQMLDDAMLLYTSCDATTDILYIQQLG